MTRSDSVHGVQNLRARNENLQNFSRVNLARRRGGRRAAPRRRAAAEKPIINAMAPPSALAGKTVAVVGGGVGGLVSAGLLAAQRELG